MKKIQGNWSDQLDFPSPVRRLFPSGEVPQLNDVRFERLLVKTPKEIVLGVRFFPPLPGVMNQWIDKGFAAVDLRLTMSDASIISLVGKSLDDQPIGTIEIEPFVTRFVGHGGLIINIAWQRLSARFLPEALDQKIQDQADTSSSTIDS
jgi:hypothetical protein